MSYCRIGEDSDVYVICAGSHFDVTLKGGRYKRLDDEAQTLEFLKLVRDAGYKVPDTAINMLALSVLESELAHST